HRPLHPTRTEAVLQERFDFATALANERNDVDIGIRTLGDLAQQRALAHTTAGKDADTLSATAGQQSIEGALPSDERYANAGAVQGWGCIIANDAPLAAGQRSPVVQRPAQAVHD